MKLAARIKIAIYLMVLNSLGGDKDMMKCKMSTRTTTCIVTLGRILISERVYVI